MEDFIIEFFIKHCLTPEFAGGSTSFIATMLAIWKFNKKQQRNIRKAQKAWEEKVSSVIKDIKEDAADLKTTVNLHTKQMDELRTHLVSALSKLGDHGDRMGSLMTAFAAYVPKAEGRMQKVEGVVSEVIQLSDSLRLVKTKLTGEDPSRG